MQKNSHAAADWFPKSIASGLVSEKYDDQIRSAANMESQSAAASDLIGCNESYSQ